MTASETAGDVRLMQWMNPPESGALTYESGASEEQRKENKNAMEERRDILVAAIEEHDDYMIAMLSVDCSKRGVKVCIPTPMVMEDRSCGNTIEQDKRYVRKRVQWLNKEIDSETKQIKQLAADIIAERRREKKYEEQDRRRREDLRNSNIGQAAARLGRDIVEVEHER